MASTTDSLDESVELLSLELSQIPADKTESSAAEELLLAGLAGAAALALLELSEVTADEPTTPVITCEPSLEVAAAGESELVAEPSEAVETTPELSATKLLAEPLSPDTIVPE